MQQYKKWFALAALTPAQAMIFMDQSILPVALPTIRKELIASDLQAEWTINSYLLFTTMFSILGGKIADRVGKRLAFMLGIFLFAVASILCGLSSNIEMLIGSRALQGIGAAFVIPSLQSLIAFIFPAESRGKTIGFSVSIASFFGISGPLIGGYLTQMFSWHWIFWINWPLACISLLFAFLYIPETPTTKQKIDLFALTLFALFTASFTLLYMNGRDWSFLSLSTIGCILSGVLSLYFLLKKEKTSPHPFLDLSLFKNHTFKAINISIAITNFVLMISMFRAMYFQTTLGYSPLSAGLITFSSGITLFFIPILGGILSDRYGPKLPTSLGYISVIVSCLWLGFFSTPSLPPLLITLILFGIGTSFIFNPSYTTAMKSIPSSKLGVGLGMIATLRTFSGTIGIAIIGFLMHLFQIPIFKKYGENPTSERIASIDSFSHIHFVLAGLMFVAFILTLIFYRRKSTHHLPEFPGEGWD